MTVVNSAAVNMGMLVCWLYVVLHSFWHMPRSGITGLYGRSMFSFLRNFHTNFHSSCANLHSHQHCIWDFFPLLHPHPCHHLLLSIFLVITILTGRRQNVNEVWFAFPLRLTCWILHHEFISYWYFLRNCSLAQLLIGLLILLVFNFFELWILILYPINNWWRYSPILYVFFWFW
jgi:hypothetical protein